MSFSPRAAFFLLIGLSAGQAKALAIPLAARLTSFETFGTSRRMSLTELAFLSIFTTAIIWLFVGTYISSMITEARVSALIRGLRRHALFRMRRLQAFSPWAAFDGTGRAGLVPRRIPARRGGLAYPMVASRTRRHQQWSHGALPV